LIGGDRKWLAKGQNGAIDPTRTSILGLKSAAFREKDCAWLAKSPYDKEPRCLVGKNSPLRRLIVVIQADGLLRRRLAVAISPALFNEVT
jgi:hypothetical protein